MPNLPIAYRWLEQVDPLPLMLRRALDEYGVMESPGLADNPHILGWAREVGLERLFSQDAIPWCGLFMAFLAARAGKEIPEKPLWALNWSSFGTGSPVPSLGDVLVFKRNSGGHVALYVGEDSRAFHVLGGNQSDRVSFTRIARERLHTARRPIYRRQPITVRPLVLAETGDISHNEA